MSKDFSMTLGSTLSKTLNKQLGVQLSKDEVRELHQGPGPGPSTGAKQIERVQKVVGKVAKKLPPWLKKGAKKLSNDSEDI